MVKDKKAQISQIQALIIPLVAIGVVLGIGFLITAEVKDQIDTTDPCMSTIGTANVWVHNANESFCRNYSVNNATLGSVSYGMNSTSTVQSALSDIPGWLPIIIITVIGALLIGLVGMFRGR